MSQSIDSENFENPTGTEDNCSAYPELKKDLTPSSAENKITISDAIASVVRYDTTLDPVEIKTTIDNLLNGNKLFEPVLAYYALSSLKDKKPICWYNANSPAALNMGNSFSGLAHYDGTIEIKQMPISHATSQSLTNQILTLFNQEEDLSNLLNQAFTIFVSDSQLNPELKNEEGFKQFIKSGWYGNTEGLLAHEIMHQVAKLIFKHEGSYYHEEVKSTYLTFNPYFNKDTLAQKEYHEAICSTLTEINRTYDLKSKQTCDDLFKFGTDLANKSGINDMTDEKDEIDMHAIAKSLELLDMSIFSVNTLLSAFNKKLYSSESLYSEFITRVFELYYILGAEENKGLVKKGYQYYCKHVLPPLMEAIENHPLTAQIKFEPNQDFGCGPPIIGDNDNMVSKNVNLEL